VWEGGGRGRGLRSTPRAPESPGKSGLRQHSSAKMHPIDQVSTDIEYSRCEGVRTRVRNAREGARVGARGARAAEHLAEEKLGCAVPQSDHLVRVVLGVEVLQHAGQACSKGEM